MREADLHRIISTTYIDDFEEMVSEVVGLKRDARWCNAKLIGHEVEIEGKWAGLRPDFMFALDGGTHGLVIVEVKKEKARLNNLPQLLRYMAITKSDRKRYIEELHNPVLTMIGASDIYGILLAPTISSTLADCVRDIDNVWAVSWNITKNEMEFYG